MKARAFNSLMHFVNEEWAAQVLNMQVNSEPGPDLIDDKKIVEVKFTLINVPRRYPLSWTVLEYQMDYPQEHEKKGFWGLGIYWMKKAVRELTKEGANEPGFLESLVTKREVYLIDWSWMYQFPPHHTSGRTDVSEWDNILRYPKFHRVPAIIQTHKVRKGIIHLTEGVNPADFCF